MFTKKREEEVKGGTEILGLSSVPRVQLAFRRKCVEVISQMSWLTLLHRVGLLPVLSLCPGCLCLGPQLLAQILHPS